MKKFIVSLCLIVLLNLDITSAAPENNSGICLDDFSSMKPAFSLSVRNDKPIANRGDTIYMEVFATGYGSVKKPAKIYFVVPKNLVDENKVFGSATLLSGFDGYTFTDFQQVQLENSSVFAVNVYEYMFKQRQISEKCFLSSINGERKYGLKERFFPPVLISINISNEADPGDHSLKYVLSYSDGIEWYQSEETVKIHVNNYWEEHLGYYNIITILSSLGIVSLFIYIIKNITKLFTKSSNHEARKN